MKGTYQEIMEYIEEGELEILLADGFEDALIAVSEHCPGRGQLAIYDIDKCIDILMKQGIEDYEEAEEHLYFNTIDAWVGNQTPIFI